jgi:two-component system chemotaxis response regulator CheB
MGVNHKIRVLIVDDSALVRQILTKGLSKDPDIEVVDAAADPYIARDMIIKYNPDVMTLDVEMPRMDGVEFLRRLMPQKPMPAFMVSSLTQAGGKITLDALDAGAIDFVTKPASNIADGLTDMITDLQAKVKMAAKVNVAARVKSKKDSKPKPLQETAASAESTDKVIAIGASTGGTEAIRQVVTRFPASAPGVVIVQHMPPGFTKMFAERLNEQSEMTVKEAVTGDRAMQGSVLIAPGDYHMKVVRSGGMYRVDCKQSEKVNGHRPSVEVLFDSVAKHVGSNAVAAILTGMGGDGGKAMVQIRKAGGRTLAQDEDTSVVFGMPKVAYEVGGAERLVPIHNIAQTILNLLVRK